MICQICNNKELQPTDAFCPTCGYEIHHLPKGASDAVNNYENSRRENYKRIWESLKEGQGIRGFLVVGMDVETIDGKTQRVVKDVLPVFQGKNVFGRMPRNAPDIHTNPILFDNSLPKEAFSFDISEDGNSIAKCLSDRWGFGNKSNNIKTEVELYDGVEMFIGNLICTFVSK